MVKEGESDRAQTPAWLRKIKSNSFIEWFNKWPTARQNLDARHRPPTWLKEERERNVDGNNVQQLETTAGEDGTATTDNDNTSTGNTFFTKLDAKETGTDNRPLGTESVDFMIAPRYQTGSVETNVDKRTSPDFFYFGQVRDSGRNTVGINIKELRQSRSRTIVCTMLGLGLILLVSVPVIVIIILAKS